MRIALIQPQLGTELQTNLRKALDLMGEAASQGAEVVAFPEIQLSPFFPQHPGQDASRYIVTSDGEVIDAFRNKARELGVVAFPNVYLREGKNLFDATIAIDADGAILGVSKMVHVVQKPCFYEQDYYTPSDTGFQVYQTTAGAIGVVICFDRHFPESFRTCALKGARLVLVPTANTTDEPLAMFDWEVRVAARQNGISIGMCNRTGIEDAVTFSGGSIVVAPDGSVVAQAGGGEEILLADLPAATPREGSYLQLRRPEMFEL